MLWIIVQQRRYTWFFNLFILKKWIHYSISKHTNTFLDISTKCIHYVHDAIPSTSSNKIRSNVFQISKSLTIYQWVYFTIVSLDLFSVDLNAIFSIMYALPYSLTMYEYLEMENYLLHLHFRNQQIYQLNSPIIIHFRHSSTVSYVSRVATVKPQGRVVDIVSGFFKSRAGFSLGILWNKKPKRTSTSVIPPTCSVLIRLMLQSIEILIYKHLISEHVDLTSWLWINKSIKRYRYHSTIF